MSSLTRPTIDKPKRSCESCTRAGRGSRGRRGTHPSRMRADSHPSLNRFDGREPTSERAGDRRRRRRQTLPEPPTRERGFLRKDPYMRKKIAGVLAAALAAGASAV